MIRFFKRGFRDLVLRLESDEALGTVTGERIIDFWGEPAQVTLHHLASGDRFALAVTEAEQPNVFEGVMPLSVLPLGYFQLEGAVADVFGNVTVLSALATPLDAAHQRTDQLGFELSAGYGVTPVFNVTGRWDREPYRATAHADTAPWATSGRYEKEWNL